VSARANPQSRATPQRRDTGDTREVGQRAELVDRLVELRKALHGSINEIARLRRANAALRNDVTKLEAELRTAQSR
jgi:phage regulator Rha-like protein